MSSCKPNHELSPPRGLRSSKLEFAGKQWLILSFPLGELELPPTLTAAERAVVRALVSGHSNVAIARQRGTSVRTVANQVASVFRKVRVGSRLELVRKFVKDMSDASPARV